MYTFTAHSDNAKRQRCSLQALIPPPQIHHTASARQRCLQILLAQFILVLAAPARVRLKGFHGVEARLMTGTLATT
jgi:hypothetical protein